MSKTEIPQNYEQNMQKLFDSSVDVLLIAEKGHGKTNALECIIDYLAQHNAKVIIFEYFPKFCLEQKNAKFIEIPENWIVETKKTVNIQNALLTHETAYTVLNGDQIKDFLKSSDVCIFLINSDDLDRIAFFTYSIIYKIYRQRYDMLRKGYQINGKTYFIISEAQNCLSSYNGTNNAKLFSKLRKCFSEFRNMNLYAILDTQKFTDVSTFYRNRCSLAIGRVNLAEFDLKVKKLLTIKDKEKVLSLPKGTFYFSAIDDFIQFPKYTPQKPEEYKPQIQKTSTPEPHKKKLSLFDKILFGLCKPLVPRSLFYETEDETEDNIQEDEKGDFLMLDDDELMFSEES
jgi:hypothetical protein